MSTASIRVIGEGALAREITALLDEFPKLGGGSALDIVVDAPPANASTMPSRATLYVVQYVDSIHVGPAVIPGVNGCFECSRRSSRLSSSTGASATLSSTQPTLRLRQAALLAVREARALVGADVNAPARTTDHVVLVRDAAVLEEIPWRPSSRCSTCGGMFRVIEREPLPSASAVESFPPSAADVDARRILEKLGAAVEIIAGHTLPGLVVAHAAAAFPRSVHARILPRPPEILASGRGADVVTAETGALFEVVERALTDAVVKHDVITARVKDVLDVAMPLDQWRSPIIAGNVAGKRFAPLDDDTELDWVWARRVVDGAPKLIPARLAFKDAGHVRGSRVLLPRKGTSGRAVSTSTYSATLAALLEVIEHDAWFSSRMTKRECRAIDLASANDSTRALVGAFDDAGYDVLARDITMPDVNVCAIEVLLRSRSDASRMFLCGRAADTNPERALSRALSEAWLVRSWERVRNGGVVKPPLESALGPFFTRAEREAWQRTSGSVSMRELPRVDGGLPELVEREPLRDAVAFDHPLPDVLNEMKSRIAIVSVVVPKLYDEVALPALFVPERARAGLRVDELDFGPWNM